MVIPFYQPVEQVFTTSDRRLKSDIRVIDPWEAIELVTTLNSYTYHLHNSKEWSAGLMADELPKPFTRESPDGYLSVDYIAVLALLWSAVNGIYKTVEEMQNQKKKKNERQCKRGPIRYRGMLRRSVAFCRSRLLQEIQLSRGGIPRSGHCKKRMEAATQFSDLA